MLGIRVQSSNPALATPSLIRSASAGLLNGSRARCPANRVLRIYLLQLGPDAPGLVNLTKMAKCGNQQAPAISPSLAQAECAREKKSLPPHNCRRQGSRAEEVYILLTINWIETDCSFNKRDRCQRITRIDLGNATRSVGLRVVRVKRQRNLTLSLHSLKVPFPRRRSCGNKMRKQAL